ncbi:hypothetical protein LCGC14_1010030 [marine sediment metagenome]|uniref:Uncharacterized protein n=1 Tax=marine sediment metagenome TaxID=412755 RepID=A0A0F9N510_9ZZZZ
MTLTEFEALSSEEKTMEWGRLIAVECAYNAACTEMGLSDDIEDSLCSQISILKYRLKYPTKQAAIKK